MIANTDLNQSKGIIVYSISIGASVQNKIEDLSLITSLITAININQFLSIEKKNMTGKKHINIKQENDVLFYIVNVGLSNIQTIQNMDFPLLIGLDRGHHNEVSCLL